jgi:GDP-L-fucose synthase
MNNAVTLALSDKILITGAGGLAGRNLLEHFQAAGFTNICGLTSKDCDLTDLAATTARFEREQPAYVFHMAGHVFGIMGNMKNQGAAYFNNTLINTHVVEACRRVAVKKIVAMGTVAMYPDPLPSNPLREATIWQGAPHHSEHGYAHAKRGMLAQLAAYNESAQLDYAFALSTNLYGAYDRFNIETGHVIPSLIRKFYEARHNDGTVTVWGDGSAQRDFLYIKDAARALHLMLAEMSGVINLATGTVNTIRAAVQILATHTGLQDRVVWDASKPNGQVVRAYDVQKLTAAGFTPAYSLAQGLLETYEWYAANQATARKE